VRSREPAAAIDVKRADVKDFIAHMATLVIQEAAMRKLLKAAQSQRPSSKPWTGPLKNQAVARISPIFVSERRIREARISGSRIARRWIAQRPQRSGAGIPGAILGVETYTAARRGRSFCLPRARRAVTLLRLSRPGEFFAMSSQFSY